MGHEGRRVSSAAHAADLQPASHLGRRGALLPGRLSPCAAPVPPPPHRPALQCKAAVALARLQVATLVGATPQELIFTSCGTESDNWAITGVVMAARRRHEAASSGGQLVPHVVTSAVEHPAVTQCLEYLKQQVRGACALCRLLAPGRSAAWPTAAPPPLAACEPRPPWRINPLPTTSPTGPS
jgi:hypothetical protein